MRILGVLLAASALWAGGAGWSEEVGEAELVCASGHGLRAPVTSSAHRKYAPDRKVDIEHLLLDVTPDFRGRTIRGKAVLRFKPIGKPLDELALDAVALRVGSVTATAALLGHQNTGEQLLLTFAEPVPVDRSVEVTIEYEAEPARGLYFRTPELGYRAEDTQIWTQGEDIEHRHWFPGHDWPNEKFTSEVICRVPKGMVALSNGRLVSETVEGDLLVFRWVQEKPHVNYLISLVAGYFKKIEDRHRDIPMAFWTPPSAIGEAPASFADTKPSMAFFEEEIGLPYPWAKYDQVCVVDYHWGGMENTSITTLNLNTLHRPETETIKSSTGLVAHELAHQWFGDLVTCKDWSHLWLNEGFATYYAHLYDERKNGRDSMLYGLYEDARGFLGRTAEADQTPMVIRTYDKSVEIFGNLIYPKGSWVLHMLRNELGTELYRKCIRTYLERHAYGTVVTEDLNAVVEELSGRSFDRFFDQWVYHSHFPELEIGYGWDARTKLARLSVRQAQKLGGNVLLFQFPLTVRFKTPAGVVERKLSVKEQAEDFYVALPAAPTVVRVDPEYALLAKTKLELPTELLLAQLDDPEDMMGRIVAIDHLRGRRDRATVERLGRLSREDRFWGVRREAVRALGALRTPEALDALLASIDQPEARVRLAVAEAVGGFYEVKAQAALGALADREKNPEIRGAALRGLAGYAGDEGLRRWREALSAESYRNELAASAIAAMRRDDDPRHVEPVMTALRAGKAGFSTQGYAAGLRALGHLARNDERKEGVRGFLVEQLADARQAVRIGALDGLGALGDVEAIAVVERWASASEETPERAPADRALRTLREGRRPVDDFKNLRGEVTTLQQSNRELKQELDQLKKRLEALSPSPAASGGEAGRTRRPVRRR